MSNTPEDCKFNNIKLFDQILTKTQIDEFMFNLYNHVIFSTFPYKLYKQQNSISCLYKYNSGNCIAQALFVKLYLERNFRVKSYIIPASVPNFCKVDGTPFLSHCALLIPISKHEFYIFDGALYFTTPIYCNLKDNKVRTISIADIYNHSSEDIEYNIKRCMNHNLDENYKQIIKTNSLCVTCKIIERPTEKWNYYLNEIENPDNNIGHSFLNNHKTPFILYTQYKDKMPTLKYKITLEDDDNIVVKEYPEHITIFSGDSELFEHDPIRNKLLRYLSDGYGI